MYISSSLPNNFNLPNKFQILHQWLKSPSQFNLSKVVILKIEICLPLLFDISEVKVPQIFNLMIAIKTDILKTPEKKTTKTFTLPSSSNMKKAVFIERMEFVTL